MLRDEMLTLVLCHKPKMSLKATRRQLRQSNREWQMALQKTGYRKVRSGLTISRRDSDYMTATYSGIDPDALWEPCPAHSCKHREIPGACREKLWRSDNNRIQDRVRWRQTNA